ncbi:MAG TPA: hypothetical protein PK530_18445 [Anaerolineales bacterium]|nr:hypothetical protein [Anaerolineales bacterium]
MELIERYLQEIGRHLPRNLSRTQRADILTELRSALMDTLDARGGNPSEEVIVQGIQEMGAPEKVAASYHAEGQYLIGPALYPTFKLVLGIVFSAVIGAQLIAIVVATGLDREAFSFYDEFLQIISSLPSALGSVVIVFALLQYWEVRPEMKAEPFDPRKLPQLEGDQPIQRGEHIFGIIMEVIVLSFVTQFAAGGGFAADGSFPNPVIHQYFFWIVLSMVVGIVLDIWLLWKGRWQMPTRLAKIGSNVFSLIILFILVQGHNAWLAEAGVGGFLESLTLLSDPTTQTIQIIGMAAFRMGLTIAFVVTVIETLVQIYRLMKPKLNETEIEQLQKTVGKMDRVNR